MKARKKTSKTQAKANPLPKESSLSIGFQSLAFKIFGGKARDLASNLRYYLGLDISRSGIMLTPEMYASVTVFATFLAAAISFLLAFFFTFMILRLYYLTCFFYSGGIAVLSAITTLMVFKLYPSMKESSIRTMLDAELPYTLSYMTVMAKAGTIPEEIIKSIARIEVKSTIARAARIILRDVAFFGRDILSALAANARKSPSRDFADVLWGISATVRTGGDLSAYLEAQARNAFAKKRVAIRKFIENLGLLGEFYVSIFVAAPLIIVVMLIVMAVLGGTITIGFGLDITTILQLITYVYLPFMAAFLIMLVDLIQPKG